MINFDLIDYDNCITNLTSSIEKFFGLTPTYKTLDKVDELLSEKDYKNVIVFVCDGMGSAIINKNLTGKNYLNNHKLMDYKACFPPTTANCTTAYLSGKNPIETAWIGWSTYYKSLDRTIDNYTNEYSLTHESVGKDNIANKIIPFEKLGNRIEKANNNVKYYEVYPYMKNGFNTPDEVEKELIRLCNEPGKKYIYAYVTDPDHYMHEAGTKSNHVRAILNRIVRLLRKVKRNTTDTIIFTSADHGQIDINEIALYTYYDIYECIKDCPSCDGRCAFFFIKDGYHERFVSLFNNYFKDSFELFTKEEILKKEIFGKGNKHPLYEDIIGDYVAIAKDNHHFMFSNKTTFFKGHHAGLHEDEITIPLIVTKN